MATTGNDITQDDLDALATLANSKLSPGTDYDLTGNSLQTELQRIRDDLFDKIFEDTESPIYKSTAALCSDPQVVGINPSPAADGRLYFTPLTQPMTETNYLPYFKDVKFYYVDYKIPPLLADDPDIFADDPDVLADGSYPITLFRKLRFQELMEIGVTWDTTETVSYTQSVTVPSETKGYITLKIPLARKPSGSEESPTQSNFTFSADIGQVLWELWQDPRTLFWYLRVKLWNTFTTGDTTITYSLSATGDWFFHVTPYDVVTDYPPDTMTVESVTTLTVQKDSPDPEDVDVIHPGGTGKGIQLEDFSGDLTDYKNNDSNGVECLEIKPTFVRGVWIAKTLPTPASNVYLDSDLPNYVPDVYASGFGSFVGPYAGEPPAAPASPGVSTAGALAENYLLENSGSITYNPRSNVRLAAPYDPNLAAFETLDGSEDGGNSLISLLSGETISGEFVFPWWLYPPTSEWAGSPQSVALQLSQSLDVYFSTSPGIDPDNSDTYGFHADTLEVTQDDLETAFGSTHKRLYYLIKNNGSDSTIVIVRTVYTNEPSIYYPVEPSVGNAVSVWPILRDTDAFPWRERLDPYRSKQVRNETIEPGGFYTDSAFMSMAVIAFKISCNPILRIRAKINGFPNGGDDELETTDGEVTLEDLQSTFGDSFREAEVFFRIYNDSASPVDVALTRQTTISINDGKIQPPEIPVFFPSNGFEEDNFQHANLGVAEPFSVCLEDTESSKSVPHRGYAIYSILVRRWPILTVEETEKHKSVYLPPTDDEDLQEIEVIIGQYLGTVHTEFESIDKGTFTPLTTITIPEGELDARVNVFWPVIQGAPIVWQCDTDVHVEALSNWQPLFHGIQYSSSFARWNGDLYVNEVDPSPAYRNSTLKFHNLFNIEAASWPEDLNYGYVHFPQSATVINDLVSALNLL